MNLRPKVRPCGHQYAACLLAWKLCAVFAAPLAVGKAVTLRWATWGPPQIDRELIAAFEKANPGIRIEYIPSSYGEHHQKVKVLTAAGQAPDVFAVDGYYTAEFATARLMRPIDDLVARDGRFQVRDFFSAALLDVQYQGKTYGLPYISAPQYLLYNLTHMAEAGLPAPNVHWNRERFLEYARKLTQSDGTRTTRWGTSQHLYWGAFWPWLWAGGGRVFDEENKRFLLTEPAALEALQWSADLRVVRNVAGSGDFVRQTVSMVQLYPGGFPSVTGVDWPFEWDVILPPAGEGGSTPSGRGTSWASARRPRIWPKPGPSSSSCSPRIALVMRSTSAISAFRHKRRAAGFGACSRSRVHNPRACSTSRSSWPVNMAGRCRTSCSGMPSL